MKISIAKTNYYIGSKIYLGQMPKINEDKQVQYSSAIWKELLKLTSASNYID